MKRVLMIGALLGALVFGAASTSQAYPYPRPFVRGPVRAAMLAPYGPRVYAPRVYAPRPYYRPYYGYRAFGPALYGPGFYGPVGPGFGFGVY
ncbi:MAG TPA: hypothetical protein VNH11_06090 [Pirellulales bacterium]|nr:hypothetical protein [Pirellulales bacterium]